MVAKVFNWFGSMSEKKPWWVIGVIVLITAVAVVGMARIKQDYGYRSMLPRGIESVKALNEADKVFGGTQEEQVVLESQDVVNPALLRNVAAYPAELQKQKDIWPSFATDVTTPLDDMVYYPGGAVTNGSGNRGQTRASVAPSLSDEELVQQVKLNLQAAAEQARKLGMTAQTNVSSDDKAMLVKVTVNPKLSTNVQIKKVKVFENLTNEYFSSVNGTKVFITGTASMNKDSSERTMKDFSRLFLLAFVFIVIVLFITFRRVTDVLLTLSVILVTVVWVEGLGGWLGFPFSYTSAAIVPLLLGIDIAYAIHVLSRYYEERRKGEDPFRSAVTSVVTVGVAVFLTAATTAFGFASFGISSMPPIQQFGGLCVAGVMFSFFLAVTLLPASLVLRDKRQKSRDKWDGLLKAKGDENKQGWLDRFLVKIAIISEHHRVIVVLVTALILGVCVFLGFQITTEADMEKMMPKDMPFVKATAEVNRYFGGQDYAYSLVKGDVLQPSTLKAMLVYEDDIATLNYITEKGTPLFERGKMFSLADLLVKVNGSIPETRADVLRVLMGMSTGKKSESSNRLINPKYPDVTMITIRVSRGAQSDMKKMAEIMVAENKKIEGDYKGLQLSSSGLPLLMNDMLGSIVPTQLKTSLVALVLCALIVILIFRSVFFGLAATSVVFIGIALEMGALALLKWPLDFMTVMVSSLVIGAGIDFGIHVTHRFREEWHFGGVEVDEAMRRTIGNVGKALVAAAVTTAGAFAIIATSGISYLRRFGGITALSLTFALLAALLFLPSVLAWRGDAVEKKKGKSGEDAETAS